MDKRLFIFLIIIFLLNPFLATLLIMLIKIIRNKRDEKSDLLLFAFLTSFACLLQATRIWDFSQPSDWYNDFYLGIFKEIPNTSFFQYVFFSSKEPAWRLLNFIGYYITDGHYFYFINGVAITTVFLICYSIYLYWKFTEADPITLIASLALIIFFTEYFDQINNILRQFFALSIVSYVYVKRITVGKKLWVLLIAASLIHTLAFLFLMLYLAKPIYERLTTKQLVRIGFVALIGVVMIYRITILQNLVSGINFLAYGLERVANAENPMDQNFLSMTNVYITAIFLIVMSIVMSFQNSRTPSIPYYYINLLMLSMLLNIAIANIAPEIMGRIYVSRFVFLPFVLPYFMINKKMIHQVYTYTIIAFFSFRFFLMFNDIRGGGFFPHIQSIILRPIFYYFIS